MSRCRVLMPVLAGAVLVWGGAFASTVQAIYSFKGARGRYPEGALTRVGGALYGTTFEGGPRTEVCRRGCGTVFRVTPDGKHHVIHYFTGGVDGAYPSTTLIDVGGILYGALGQGDGAVFSVTQTGTVTILHAFDWQDGDSVTGTLAALGNTLYGVTQYGGSYNKGVVFGVTTAGGFAVVHDFAGAPADGAEPMGGLAASRGRVYGTTTGGGAASRGTVFTLTPDGTETILHSFSSTDPLGEYPRGSMAAVGNRVYGTTQSGGPCCGVLFAVQASGRLTSAHSFQDASDGEFPIGDLTAANGTVYGVTEGGGSGNYGTVYSYSHKEKFKTLASFPANEGFGLQSQGVTYDRGALLGTSSAGGAYERGVIYAVKPAPSRAR